MWTINNKSPKRKIIAFIQGIAMLFGIATTINILLGNYWQFDSLLQYFKANGFGVSVGFAFWMTNWLIGANMGTRLNWRKNPLKANVISLLLFIGSGLTISIIWPYFFAKYVWLVPAENFALSVVLSAFVCLTIDLVIVAIYYSQYMVTAWQKTLENEEALKRENLVAKYEALKNQVNPHFLFNTLNTLAGVVEQSPQQAQEFIARFSGIYRYVLEQRDKELVTLAEELNFLQNFMYLAKIRHGSGLIVNINLNPEGVLMVPMALQILFENALKHNVITDAEPLTIDIGRTDNYLFVRNNLQPKTSLNDSSKIGIENLTRRYQYLSNLPVIVNQTPTKFEVKLPVITAQ